MKLIWHGRQVTNQIGKDLTGKLHVIGALLSRDVGTMISKPGPRPSAPGEPPHTQTRRLWQSITHEVKGQVLRVGTNVKYARYLELGTERMPGGRPFLRPALDRARNDIVRILRG